jgi:signal-transduction protein with cAMP-binding, CBS, and nucleotidyltransferase domain
VAESRPDSSEQNPPPHVPIATRPPERVGGLTVLRGVARCMIRSGVGAVVVESPVGKLGLVTAGDLIEAIANGADPDLVWAGDIMRPIPRTVSHARHPVDVGEEMATYELEVVTVTGDDEGLGIATALDVLRAVLRSTRKSQDRS